MLNSTEEYVLHDSRERRPGSGRPSLLSADPATAPAPEDRSVLSQLDGRAAPARGLPSATPRARRRGMRAAFFGAALAGIAGAGWFALGSGGDAPEAPLTAAHVAAPPVKAPAAVPPPAPAVPATLASADPPEAPANAAVIQDDLPAAKADKHDLASLLNAPASASVAAADARPKSQDDAPRKHVTAKKTATEKLARNEKARAPAASARAKPAHKPVQKRAEPAVDSDVALLAALLAHTKTPDSGSPDDIFRRCATNATATEVQRCRVRVCQSSAQGAAGCKSVRVSKAPG